MIFQHILLALAAFVAGTLNAIAGGGTFLTYPVLLLAGSSSLVANATSTVVLWPGILSSLPAYKKEIKAVRRWIKLLFIPSLLGGIIGGYILTHTKNNTFSLLAPLLIIIGSLVLRFENQVDQFFKRLQLAYPHQRITIIALFIFAIAIYGAYFGAGIGILLLGCLSVLGLKNLYREIALKNVLALIINFTAVIYFAFSHIVDWKLVPLMTVCAILGGVTGSHLVRHLDTRKVKNGVVVLGFIIAITLFIVRLG